MHKITSRIALSVLTGFFLISSNVQASDNSASLAISGKVRNRLLSSCTITISPKSVSFDLLEEASLDFQGNDLSSSNASRVNITRGSSCYQDGTASQIAFRVLGTTDPVENSVLLNTLADDTAAKGVGVGVFTLDGKPFIPNLDTFVASKDDEAGFYLDMVKLKNNHVSSGKLQTTLMIQVERL